ncbi:MAG: hypothetical protein PWQ82_99 [Thermosediminibacterales bacterium]|nr:hypothetical protein [Thermosediminibacterales bacterium]MDK2836391.1 hypothetical protein [Thermosediminibacterales bacterium]
MIKDLIYDEFQNNVANLLIRHRSILDVMTKLSESTARINRALAKSITNCGCLEVKAQKQQIPKNITLQELKDYMKTHLSGSLCPTCKEIIEHEIGSSLFYLTALCELLDLNLYDVLVKENDKISTLGIYNMS